MDTIISEEDVSKVIRNNEEYDNLFAKLDIAMQKAATMPSDEKVRLEQLAMLLAQYEAGYAAGEGEPFER